MIEVLDGATRLFPIIGDPIVYMKSPERLTRGLIARGHNAMCVPMQVRAGELQNVMHALSLIPNIDGLLVTMPHKHAAFSLCADSSDRSKLLQAVSVIRRNDSGSWHGEMLDGVAFVKAQQDQGAKPRRARVLLLGAGAAGSAIALALLEAGVDRLIIHDTDSACVTGLIASLPNGYHERVIAGPADPTGCDLVCNATSSGMTNGDHLPVLEALLTSSMFVGDVIAGHGETAFLSAARRAGCKTANGDRMVDAVQEMMLDFLLGA